jgi:hypothetical protein
MILGLFSKAFDLLKNNPALKTQITVFAIILHEIGILPARLELIDYFNQNKSKNVKEEKLRKHLKSTFDFHK